MPEERRFRFQCPGLVAFSGRIVLVMRQTVNQKPGVQIGREPLAKQRAVRVKHRDPLFLRKIVRGCFVGE